MDIITAKEAKERTASYISPSLKTTIEYVMEVIKNSCDCGDSTACFNNNPFFDIFFKSMKSNEFIEFIKNLGYEYDYTEKECLGEYCEEITISW